MTILHKSCRSSRIVNKFTPQPKVVLSYYCEHCDQFLETYDTININYPLADCISIIKGKNNTISEMIINAIGRIKC